MNSPMAEFDVTSVSVPLQFDQIDSKFVSIQALINSDGLDARLRFYLPLYLELIFKTCLSRDGGNTIIPHTDGIAQISRDTVGSGAGISSSGLISIGVKVEERKFRIGVDLVKDVMYHAHFTEERIKTVATTRINDLPAAKRSASCVLGVLENSQNYKSGSLAWSSSLMRQHSFLTGLLAKLQTEEGLQSILDELKAIQRAICHELDLIIHVAGDAKRLTKVLPADDLPLTKHFLVDSWPRISSATPDSSSTNHSKDSLIQFLTQEEGPMWGQIRGRGLAYDFGLSLSTDVGLLYFSLSNATHLVEAFKKAATIVKEHIEGDEEFDDFEFEGAKCSLIFEIIEGGKTVADVAAESMDNYFLGLPLTHSQELISRIMCVEMDDLVEVGRRYLLPVFEAASSRSSLVCHPTKIETLQKEFQEIGYSHHQLPNLDHEFLSSIDR